MVTVLLKMMQIHKTGVKFVILKEIHKPLLSDLVRSAFKLFLTMFCHVQVS